MKNGLESQYDTRVPIGVKDFLSQKIFRLFFQNRFLRVSGLWDNSKRNFFFEFQTIQSPGIAMRLQRQKLPFTCNQRRGTLLFRITWKGDWTSGVSLRYESTSRGQKFSKSKKFSSFSSNRVFPMFQDSGIILSEKIFSQFQTTLSPGIAMRSQRQKLPLTCHQRRRTLPVRITWKGDWTSGVSLRCESTSRGQKFSKSKNFQLFSNRVFPMFQDSGIILSEKIFSDFQTTLSPGIAMRSQRQKLLLTCNQRRRTLPVRIIWKGVSLHCDARVPDASRGQKFSKSKKFSTFFQNGFSSCFRTLG